jgi:uncharacterized protein DUF4382
MYHAFSRPALLTLLAITLTACGGGGSSSGSKTTTGTLNLAVTDAPVYSAQQVLVQFTGVSVKPAQGEAIDIPLTGDSQSCLDLLNSEPPTATPAGSTTVRCIDLLQLQGTQSASLLSGEVLEAGNYNWMRLAVDAQRSTLDSIFVRNDGTVESLYVPSGKQSGLKLNTGFTILAGGDHDFVIDFNLQKSVNDPQGFPDYRLTPSLRLIDLAESGNIVGTVAASLLSADGCSGNGNAVYVYQGGDGTVIGEEGSADAPLTSATVNLDNDSGQWSYTAGFIAPGEYTVAFTCQAENDSSESADNGIEFTTSPDSPTTVVADQDSTVNFSL